MPEFIRPKRAIIEEGGSGYLGMLALLASIVFVILLAVAVAAWILAHAVLLAIMLAVFVAALGGFCVWCRWVASPRRLAEMRAAGMLPQPVAPIAVQRAILGHQAVTAGPQRAIAPARHLHIHLHGVSAEDAAAVINRQEIQP